MQPFTTYGLINEKKRLVFSSTDRYARDYCEIVQTQPLFRKQPDCQNTTLVYWAQTPGSPTVVHPVEQEQE